MLTTFFKKYWFNVALVVVIIAFVFYIIPIQEQTYLQPDIALVKRKANLALIFTLCGLITFILIYAGRKFRDIKKFFNLFGSLIFIGLGFYFLLSPIFLSATYFINTLSQRDIIKKNYTVVYINHDKKDLFILDDITQSSIDGDIILIKNNSVKLNVKDKILVSFRKGLLGFNFDPQLEMK